MNPFQYKDGKDFLEKTGLTIDQALDFLDTEIKTRCDRNEHKKQNTNGQRE